MNYMDHRTELHRVMHKYFTGKVRDPLLSIFIPARNDGFMENFNYRLGTTIEYIAQNFAVLGRLQDVELIIVDWNSEVPLHNVLELSQEARSIVRYIIVPPEAALPAQKDSPFPIVLLQNIALRRARGTYLMQTDSDVMFMPPFLETIMKIIDSGDTHCGRADRLFFSSQRKHIPWEFISKCPTIRQIEDLILAGHDDWVWDTGLQYGYCATGMMMMHRDLWFDVRGYDERLLYWGWMEIDLGMRVTQKYEWCDVTRNFGIILFHMEHVKSTATSRPTDRKSNPMDRPVEMRANDDNWGMADIVFPEFTYGAPALMLLR